MVYIHYTGDSKFSSLNSGLVCSNWTFFFSLMLGINSGRSTGSIVFDIVKT